MTNRLIAIAAFTGLSGLWLAFGAALVFEHDMLAGAWQLLRAWPWVMQALAWLLALPVVLGLWIWQTSWPVLVRLALVAGLAWATVYTFYPWKPARQPGGWRAGLGG